jgi:hypothetical protein
MNNEDIETSDLSPFQQTERRGTPARLEKTETAEQLTNCCSHRHVQRLMRDKMLHLQSQDESEDIQPDIIVLS